VTSGASAQKAHGGRAAPGEYQDLTPEPPNHPCLPRISPAAGCVRWTRVEAAVLLVTAGFRPGRPRIPGLIPKSTCGNAHRSALVNRAGTAGSPSAGAHRSGGGRARISRGRAGGCGGRPTGPRTRLGISGSARIETNSSSIHTVGIYTEHNRGTAGLTSPLYLRNPDRGRLRTLSGAILSERACGVCRDGRWNEARLPCSRLSGDCCKSSRQVHETVCVQGGAGSVPLGSTATIERSVPSSRLPAGDGHLMTGGRRPNSMLVRVTMAPGSTRTSADPSVRPRPQASNCVRLAGADRLEVAEGLARPGRMRAGGYGRAVQQD